MVTLAFLLFNGIEVANSIVTLRILVLRHEFSMNFQKAASVLIILKNTGANVKFRKQFLRTLIIFAAWLGACQTSLLPGDRVTEEGFQDTQVALTVDAILSQTSQAPLLTPTLSDTPLQQDTLTQSPTQTPTNTPQPTNTPLPTNTPVPTNTPIPTITPTPIVCNRASFIRDVTIADGTQLSPRSNFLKIWQVKNTGACTWTTHYTLAFSHGDLMSGDQRVPFQDVVPPGDITNVGVELIAPRDEGSYRGYWHFRDDRGIPFGIGSDADATFWVDIQVIEIERFYSYNFAANFCTADWESSSRDLRCPGDENDDEGFVILLENPALENRKENEPALWVHPDEVRGGTIEGIYPRIRIEADAHFRTWVGCLEGYQNCDLTFYLDAITSSGRYIPLGQWHEVYEGLVKEVDIDLSRFEGELLRFILGVKVNNQDFNDSHGFWFVPRIEISDE